MLKQKKKHGKGQKISIKAPFFIDMDIRILFHPAETKIIVRLSGYTNMQHFHGKHLMIFQVGFMLVDLLHYQ
jgi:hypothetical protein